MGYRTRTRIKTANLFKRVVHNILQKTEELTVSQWAEKYRVLDESSNISGRWSNDVTPYLIDFNPLRPRGRRQQYYTKKTTILHHISTIKSHHTPSNHRQPTLHTSKTVLIVQFFRCESPRKFMFASGSHQTI